MIRKYKFSDLPRSFYGKKYDIFSFEVFDGVPHILYIGNTDEDMIAITGLDELRRYRTKYLYQCEVRLYTPRLSSDDYPLLVTRDRIADVINYYENEIKAIHLQNSAKMFETFLESITVVKNGEILPLGIKHDLRFADDYYGIKIKTREIGDSDSASITMSCDNAAINKSVAETIDILKDINNAEDEA